MFPLFLFFDCGALEDQIVRALLEEHFEAIPSTTKRNSKSFVAD
jgi:hypothetical protein